MFAWLRELSSQERKTLDRLVRRMVGRCARRDGLHVRDPHVDRDLEHEQGAGGLDCDRDLDHVRARRMAGRHPRRPHRAREGAAVHHSVVRGLHVPVRLHQLVRATAADARAAGPGVRRRVGGGLGADRRDDAGGPSRQGRGHGSERLGGRLGRRRPALRADLLPAPRGAGVAGHVLGRHPARAAGALHPPPREGFRDLPRHPRPGRREGQQLPRDLLARTAAHHRLRQPAHHRA